MWKVASNVLSSVKFKKDSRDFARACDDDDVCSNDSRDEGLECPICLESFNIVENIPYVLWCGHTLCQNCVFGLQCAVLKISTQPINIPFFISCPWCNLLSLRLVYKGNLKLPRKNFFLLWMVENLNGDTEKFVSSSGSDSQPIWFPNDKLLIRRQSGNTMRRMASYSHHAQQLGSHGDVNSRNLERDNFSLPTLLDFFINFRSKFLLVIIFLLMVLFVIPGSAFILVLYLLGTVLFAIPSFLILYFAYPTLDRLWREITS